ncbi:hypothetical protein TNCT_293141 [Trichonephila clavata]|uniref:Uncharacterized protein n=1 Tax=Trichonephila clavata TaxID=2740835 RepID=A0A8X6H205_TRICU|nr:hypothetical protein TNCT_293141 [Trichonephila clavata]
MDHRWSFRWVACWQIWGFQWGTPCSGKVANDVGLRNPTPLGIVTRQLADKFPTVPPITPLDRLGVEHVQLFPARGDPFAVVKIRSDTKVLLDNGNQILSDSEKVVDRTRQVVVG